MIARLIDHPARAIEWLRQHPGSTWDRPRRAGEQHVITWKGHREAHHDLGQLMDRLEAGDEELTELARIHGRQPRSWTEF